MEEETSNFKIALIVVGVLVLLALSIFWATKSGSQKAEVKAPPGYEIVYPKDSPPRSQLKS